MAQVALAGSSVVRVTFDYPVRPSEARAGLERAGRLLQDRVASEFEKAQTHAGPLARNSTAYNIRKVLQGLDIRRGHRSGRLQNALYGVKAYSVSGSGRRWAIRFSDLAVVSRVPYARWYIRDKVPSGKLVGVERAWLPPVREVAEAIDAGARVRTERAQRPQPATAMASLRNLIEFVTGG